MKNLLEQIQSRLDGLNKAECKVAKVTLQNPQQATRFSIAVLAQTAAAGEPTMNRFCRSFDMSGYPELKIQLTQGPASGAAFVTQAVAEDDGPEVYMREISSNIIASLDSAHKLLDSRVIDRVVDLLIQARQIHFSGLGASAPVVLDAQHKSFHLNLAVGAQAGVLIQQITASVAYTDGLFVVISYTESTRELVGMTHLVRENGASVLGLTTVDSPLARASTLCLGIPLPEDTDIYMPMISRVIQLTVLDVLVTGVILCRGVNPQPHLWRAKESLAPIRYPLDEDN